MALASGTKLGPYEILAPLGAGGMGEVYRARDTRLGRDVAVKILPRELSDDAVRKQRFEREAKTISGLNHPNICTLHDVGSQDGLDYLVMECLEGESLAQKLARGPLPLDQVIKYGSQIADALEKAHRAGIVHRDLKPGNIMVTQSGAKLLDFGLAKPAALNSSLATLTAVAPSVTPVTQEGTIVGTFQYMSPEQVEGKDVDGRSDIFSLGAVLYEMLTGRHAFPGKSQLSVASAILEKEPEPISAVKPLTPPLLERTIRKCLAKNPDERWQSASDLRTQLQWTGEGPSAIEPVGRKGSGAGWSKAGWVVSALLLLALASFLLLTNRSHPARQTQYFASPFHIGANNIAISPDGHTTAIVAYWDEGNKYAIWLYRLGEAAPKILEGSEGAMHPFWSPDGKWIAFFSQGKLKRIVIEGKSVEIICDAPNGRGGTWGPDGTILFTPDVFTGLYKVPATGGTPTELTKLDPSRPESSHRWPVFLPDGRHFLFLGANFSGNSEVNAIQVGSLDSPKLKVIMPASSNAAYAVPGYLVYEKDGALVAQKFDLKTLAVTGEPRLVVREVRYWTVIDLALFAVGSDGTIVTQTGGELAESRLNWYDRQGKLFSSVTSPGSYSNPNISPDGTRVAYDQRRPHAGESSVWVQDLKSGTASELTLNPSLNQVPVWSADGKRIIFTSNRQVFNRVYEKNSDGSGQERAATDLDVGRQINAWDWSRDGKYILLRNENELWVYSVAENKSHAYLKEKWLIRGAQFSPDQKFVAYTTNETGGWEVYVSPFPEPTSKWKVSRDGGEEPRWSADGKELFYLAPDGRLMSAGVRVGATFEAMTPVPLFQTRGRQKISSQDVFTYAVGGNGEKFLFNTVTEQKEAPPLLIIMNWAAELEK